MLVILKNTTYPFFPFAGFREGGGRHGARPSHQRHGVQGVWSHKGQTRHGQQLRPALNKLEHIRTAVLR